VVNTVYSRDPGKAKLLTRQVIQITTELHL
jgi:hypothetical protein